MPAEPHSHPMDHAQRRLAERRLIAAVRRLHRRDPLKPDLRIDAVLAELRADPGERLPEHHRGAGTLQDLPDPALIEVLDALAAEGRLVRAGRRMRLPSHEPALADPQMRERVEHLLTGLRASAANPPRVDAVAGRLGIPRGVIDQLRAAGSLVRIADGVDYPRDVLDELLLRLDALAGHGPLTVARVRDALHTSRRHAEALLDHRRSFRRASRPTRHRTCPDRRR